MRKTFPKKRIISYCIWQIPEEMKKRRPRHPQIHRLPGTLGESPRWDSSEGAVDWFLGRSDEFQDIRHLRGGWRVS
jgi:hypothetical protein